jgi:hypothetical protein
VATHGLGVFSGTSAPVPPPPEELPLITDLEQNYPNPFNPGTRLRFTLGRRSYVTLKIYSITGAEVAVLVDGMREIGADQEQVWTPVGISTGVYFAVLQTEDVRLVRKMVYLK